jgi:hypothetical protein
LIKENNLNKIYIFLKPRHTVLSRGRKTALLEDSSVRLGAHAGFLGVFGFGSPVI